MHWSRASERFVFSGARFSENKCGGTSCDSPRRRSQTLSALAFATCVFLTVLGCAGPLTTRKPRLATPPERSQPAAPRSASSAPTASPTALGSIVTVGWAETSDFRLPIPAGYRNATAEFPDAAFSVVIAKNEAAERYRSTIVLRRVPIPGGSFDEPSACEQTGRGLVLGGTDEPGTGGMLKSAQIIDGPVGKTCQIHLIAPQGVALLTELHRPGNSRSSPKDIWLMTCNYVDGDALAESMCRFALSGFRFRDQ